MAKPNRKAREKLRRAAHSDHRYLLTKVKLAAAIGFAASGGMTAKGIFENNVEAGVTGVPNMLMAAAAAAVSTSTVWASSSALFDLSFKVKGVMKCALLATTAAYIPLLASISTQYNVSGLVG